MKKKWLIATLAGFILLSAGCYYAVTQYNIHPERQVGEVVDELHGVPVYYNGGINYVRGRNTTADGYNLGLEYQCVEFVKRYYYVRFGHKMPDSYGHAKSFFNTQLESGALNPQRGMLQFSNGSTVMPQADDLLVFRATLLNRYGHVAVISAVTEDAIEIVQQNPGPFASSRESFKLLQDADGQWRIDHSAVLGFLRLPP